MNKYDEGMIPSSIQVEVHREVMKDEIQKEFERLNKVLDKLPVGEAAECYRQLRGVILTIKTAKK